MFVNFPRSSSPILAFSLVCALSGCTGNFHRKWADHEVYGILREKSARVPNAGDALLNIDPPTALSLEKLARNLKTEEFLGDRSFIEKDARIINLADALQYGVERNRTYLGQKENVYQDALDLTGVRHDFSLIPHSTGTGQYDLTRDRISNVVTNRTFTTRSDTGFSALQSTGALIATNLTTDVVRLITGRITSPRDSKIAVTLSQPLLKGAGILSVTEPLTQAERDVLYSIRDFAEYRKTFTINVTTQFYQTLQARSSARNAYLAYQAFKKLINQQTELTKANVPGRTFTALGLLQQAELTYHRNWINTIKSYEAALDDLKITLGLPVSERIVLDQKELEKLVLISPRGTLEEAVQTAMVSRNDLWNQRDALEDAARHVRIAKQNLLPGVNAFVSFTTPQRDAGHDLQFDSRRHDLSAGADFDLHLDQKPARNDLRSAQIAEQKARRNLDLAEENVRGDVRKSWRNLDLAAKQFDLAEQAVKLNEVRLAREEDYDREGRGQARDLIDAQAALIQANDDRIAALVNHTVARIQLWKDMGILFIKKDGRWEDVLQKESPQGKHD